MTVYPHFNSILFDKICVPIYNNIINLIKIFCRI